MDRKLKEEELVITNEDLEKFKNAKNFDEQLKILIAHSQQNHKRLIIRRKRKMEENQKKVEKEMLELNKQFSEFLHTKGIKAKFKLAFANMAESAKKQHEIDVQNFNEIKNSQENKDFIEFLHTKGIKAKFKLVIENIKKGAATSRETTARNIAKVRAETQASIARVNGKPTNIVYTAQTLEEEFNQFLKSKGLDSKYTVTITEEN